MTPQPEYIITEEQLHKTEILELDDGEYEAIRSRPYSAAGKVLDELHKWFENYCEGNEEPDLWMAFLKAEWLFREQEKCEQ